jgi:hypothetical protein
VRASDQEPTLRAGDADRERSVAELRRHHLDGRLDAAELEERLGRAYAARTLGELAALFADLPLSAGVERAPGPPQQPGGPGMRSFAQTHELPVPVAVAYREGLRTITGTMARYGYRLSAREAEQALVFESGERPFWAYVLCVVLFPVGLLVLLKDFRSEVRVDVVALPGQRSRLLVTGKARRAVRRSLLQLSA